MAGSDPDEDPNDDELDLVRQALDYTPNEVLRDLADEDDADLLASIDERLDRIVIEEVEIERGRYSPATTETDRTAEDEPDDEALEATEDEEVASTDEPEPAPELDESDVSLGVVLSEADDEEDEGDDETPVEVVVTEAEGADEDDTEGNVEVVLAETPEGDEEPAAAEPDEAEAETVDEGELVRETLASADPQPGSSTPWPDEDNGHGPGAEVRSSPYDVLNSFTVVAPPTGSIEGQWSVAGEEDAAASPAGEQQWVEEEEDDLDLGIGEGPEDEFDEELDEDLEEDLFGDEELEDDLDEDADEDEILAEADPEQEVDDEFWEDLLEDEPAETEAEPEATEDDFEDEGFEDLWDEPEEEPAEATEEEATEEDETFEDLWEDLDEDADEEATEPTTFQTAETSGAADEGLEFEEVEFEQAEPEPVSETDETVRGTPAEEPAEAVEPDEVDEPDEVAEPEEVEAEATAQAEWPSEEDESEDEVVEAEAPEPADTGEGYSHGPYTLYHKVVETGQGEPRDLYFFARNPPEDADPSELPDGYEVGVNERTGVPFVREEDDA